MAHVLTEASTVACPHGSPVTLVGAGAPKLRVMGAAVLVESSDSAWLFTCAPPAPAKKCTKVVSVAAKTVKLRVQGGAVLVEPAPSPTLGATDGAPPTPVSAAAAQTKLSSI
jgi:hypothetical protein